MRVLIASERGVRSRLAVLFAIGLALRLGGISFGLPYLFHPDEPVHVGDAIRLLSGVPEALSFANPALYKYVLAALYGLLIGVQRLPEVGDAPVYLIARTTSAVFGAVTILAVYWLATLVRGRLAGLIAAGLAAVTYLLVRESHFAVNDALAALATTLAVGCSVRVACRGARRDYLAAGAAMGIAFAAKYQAAAVIVPLLVAHVQHGRQRRDLNLLLALGLAGCAAVVAFPPLLTEPRRVAGDIWVNIVLPSRLGWPGIDPAVGGYVYYLEVLEWGIGWPMAGLACIGAAWAVVRRDWRVIVVASLPAAMYTALGGSHTYFARYLLPAIPPLIVVAAALLHDVARRAPLLAVALALGVVVWTLPNSLRFDELLTRTDTRTMARMWMQANLPAGSRVAVERPGIIGPPVADLGLDLVFPPDNEMFNLSLDAYREQRVEYVVTSSFTAEEGIADPSRSSQRAEFYAALNAQADQLVEFRPYHGTEPTFLFDRIYAPFDALDRFDQPGPTITIYRIMRS